MNSIPYQVANLIEGLEDTLDEYMPKDRSQEWKEWEKECIRILATMGYSEEKAHKKCAKVMSRAMRAGESPEEYQKRAKAIHKKLLSKNRRNKTRKHSAKPQETVDAPLEDIEQIAREM